MLSFVGKGFPEGVLCDLWSKYSWKTPAVTEKEEKTFYLK